MNNIYFLEENGYALVSDYGINNSLTVNQKNILNALCECNPSPSIVYICNETKPFMDSISKEINNGSTINVLSNNENYDNSIIDAKKEVVLLSSKIEIKLQPYRICKLNADNPNATRLFDISTKLFMYLPNFNW